MSEFSFGQRIGASLQSLVGRLKSVLDGSIDHEQAEYHNALLVMGRRALESDERAPFVIEGSLALIAALIESGVTKRDEIVKSVRWRHTASYRLAGYLLGKHAGDDPSQHLWFKTEGGNYRLHNSSTEIKRAA